MDKTIRALTELATVDRALREAAPAGARALEAERAALRRKLSAMLLTTYDALARAGKHPAIVATRDGYCGGCNLRLPPQLDYQIRGEKNLFRCPYCQRMLHSMPWSESERHLGSGR